MSDTVPRSPVDARQASPVGRRRWRATVSALVVGVVSAALSLCAYATGALDRVELDSVDTRFSLRGTSEPPLPLAVVAIDEATLREAGAWPIGRGWHARTIDALRRDGARAIAYDVQFTEPSLSPEEDNELIRAARRAAGKLVLATAEADSLGESGVFGGQDVVDAIGIRVGNTSLRLDGDATLRRIPHSAAGLETFGLVGAELASGRTIDPSELGGALGWIDFLGPPGTVPHYSLVRVARGEIEPGTFRGKVVVVGASAPSLRDFNRTATGAHMDGPEQQANVLATAFAGFPLQGAPGWLDVLLILACGLVVPLVRLRLRLRLTLLAALGAGVTLAVGTQLAFQAGWVTSFVYPLLALVLSTLGVVVLAVGAAQPRATRPA
jgi:adenylate cyclase